jgi:HlyD family secretion protein
MEGVVTELREVTAEVEELILEIVTRQSQLDRVEIRAPVAGVVHDLKIAAEGEVLPPGGTLTQIVPIAEDLSFEIVVDPRAIEDVYPGQAAQVVIASRNPQSAPRLDARVATISPDVIEDERTGESFYRATLKLAPGALESPGVEPRDLVQGMPVEVFLQTGSRSVLAYLLHPVTTHLRRTFRE